MKTTPHGEKRPYSEAALAELQKADTLAPAPVAKAETPQKPLDRAPENGEDEAVSWMWPTQGKILGPFDEAKRGIDIAGNSGQDVLAAADGKVSYATSIRGYGNLVIIKHTNNLLSAYAHNKTILVKENQTVTKGQKIAEMGNTDSDAVKLHFEIRQQGKPVDPAKFLPGR
jgi:lipoprotein NlpD